VASAAWPASSSASPITTTNFLGSWRNANLFGAVLATFAQFPFGFTGAYLFDAHLTPVSRFFPAGIKFDQARRRRPEPAESGSITRSFSFRLTPGQHRLTVFARYPVRKLSFTRICAELRPTRPTLPPSTMLPNCFHANCNSAALPSQRAQWNRPPAPSPRQFRLTPQQSDYPPAARATTNSSLSSGCPASAHVKSLQLFDWKYYHPVNNAPQRFGFSRFRCFITVTGAGHRLLYSRFYLAESPHPWLYFARSRRSRSLIRRRSRSNSTDMCATCLNGFGQPPRGPSVCRPVTRSRSPARHASLRNLEYRIPSWACPGGAFSFDGVTTRHFPQECVELDPTARRWKLNFPRRRPCGVEAAALDRPGTNFRPARPPYRICRALPSSRRLSGSTTPITHPSAFAILPLRISSTRASLATRWPKLSANRIVTRNVFRRMYGSIRSNYDSAVYRTIQGVSTISIRCGRSLTSAGHSRV